MSDPTRVSDSLPRAHRIVTPKYSTRERASERFWSCNRCQGKGYVYETVALHLGGLDRTYRSVARCRCAAGERLSPTIAQCSDSFWYGIGNEPEAEPPADPDDWTPPPPEPEPAAPTQTTWTGPIVQELDP